MSIKITKIHQAQVLSLMGSLSEPFSFFTPETLEKLYFLSYSNNKLPWKISLKKLKI